MRRFVLRSVVSLAVLTATATGCGAAGGSGGGSEGEGSSGSSGRETDDPVATIAHCTDGNGIAQVMVDNSADAQGSYVVRVSFTDGTGRILETVAKTVDVTGKGGLVTPVQMTDPSRDDGKLTCGIASFSAA